MNDYANFEKVGKLPKSLPRNDEKITTEAGDIILYQGNQVTIYYDENTWNFTRIGKIDNITQSELKEILGTGSVSVTFSLERKTGVFDMEHKTVMLNSGYEMPVMGLGTYSLLDDNCVDSVVAELQSGGRLIDTAYMYHNEKAVGEGIRKSGIPREEIFVETKLYPNQYSDAENAIDEALEKLDVDYIDLMLLHHPGMNDVEAYKAMEQAVADGKIRSIGLSNWYIEELEDFLPQITIMPALVQNEIHPYYQEIEVVPYIQSLGIVVQGWYPLGGRGYTAELLGDETINAIADLHGVSSAQVILRWNLQRGVVVIPGSSNPDHIRENLDLFRFELSDGEMEQIKKLNRDEKHDWY
ncbi:MAG: aldo/keto reductase [Ruminococcus sp.]|nr:aldo/keto reductase [Ruminococcus sp.]